MPKRIYWFRELVDLRESWAEKLKYGRLLVAGFPIPTGFFITPEAKKDIRSKLCVDNLSQISPSSIPEELKKEIVDSYFKLNLNYDMSTLPEQAQIWAGINRDANLVLVQSGPKAYPNVRGTGELLEAVLKCMSAGEDPVLVQKMVSPEKGGVLITSKDGEIYLEATYGFASPIIRGEIEPDIYNISKTTGDVKNKKLGSKQFSMITNPYNRTIEKVDNSAERKNSYVLYDREIEVIAKLSKMLESYAKKSQKATWVISNKRVYLIDTEDYSEGFSFEKPAEVINFPIEAPTQEPELFPSPIINKEPEVKEEWEKFDSPAPSDNLFSKDFSSTMDLFAEKAPEQKPFSEPVFSEPKQDIFSDFTPINAPEPNVFSEPAFVPSYSQRKIGIYLNSMSSSNLNSAAAYSPSTLLLRIEDVFASAGVHPGLLQNMGPLTYSDKLSQALISTIAPFRGKEIIIGLSDLRSDKFGGNERNPLLGQRGARKLGTQIFEIEMSALSKIASQGNIFKIAIPFITSAWELQMAKDILYRYGLASSAELGAIIETPAAVSIIDQICEKAKFVILNTDTLTELLLAVDRNNESVRSLFDFKHDAVKNAVSGVIKICKSKNIPVYITGEALKDSEFLRFVKEKGAELFIADLDSFNKVKQEISSGAY